MKRPRVALLAALLCLWGCGKKGAILPPLVRVPNPPEILSLLQRGAHIILEWANPSTYADGRPLPGVARVEVWRADAGPEGAAFESRASILAVVRRSEFPRFRIDEGMPPGTMRLSLALGSDLSAGRALVFGLRAVDTEQRKSPFSALRGVRPKPLPLPPLGLKADIGPDAVTLYWEPSRENIDGSPAVEPAGFRVFRAEGDGPLRPLTVSLVGETTYHDREFTFGRTYRYVVRAVVAAEEPPVESDDSPVLEVTPRDIFPPAPPAGLTTLPGEDFISLVWDPGIEKDLAGYRVWRREEGSGDFRLLNTDLLSETSFIDRAVEKGKRYEYAISAEDRAGNRSRLSDGVFDSLRTTRS